MTRLLFADLKAKFKSECLTLYKENRGYSVITFRGETRFTTLVQASDWLNEFCQPVPPPVYPTCCDPFTGLSIDEDEAPVTEPEATEVDTITVTVAEADTITVTVAEADTITVTVAEPSTITLTVTVTETPATTPELSHFEEYCGYQFAIFPQDGYYDYHILNANIPQLRKHYYAYGCVVGARKAIDTYIESQTIAQPSLMTTVEHLKMLLESSEDVTLIYSGHAVHIKQMNAGDVALSIPSLDIVHFGQICKTLAWRKACRLIDFARGLDPETSRYDYQYYPDNILVSLWGREDLLHEDCEDEVMRRGIYDHVPHYQEILW